MAEITQEAHEAALAEAKRQAEADRLAAKKTAEDAAAEAARAQKELEAAIAARTALETTYTEKFTKTQDRMVTAELKAAAIAAGLVDLDLVKLIDRAEIKIGDDGEIEGIEAAVAKFKEAKPRFFQAAEAAAPPPPKKTGEPVPPKTGNNIVPIRELSKADYEKRKAEFRSKLRGRA